MILYKKLVRIYTNVPGSTPNRSDAMKIVPLVPRERLHAPSVTVPVDEADKYLKMLQVQSDQEYFLETDFQAIKAKPEVHGFWIDHPGVEEYDGRLISNYECSNCHQWSRYTTEFCPHCGCEMDV